MLFDGTFLIAHFLENRFFVVFRKIENFLGSRYPKIFYSPFPTSQVLNNSFMQKKLSILAHCVNSILFSDIKKVKKSHFYINFIYYSQKVKKSKSLIFTLIIYIKVKKSKSQKVSFSHNIILLYNIFIKYSENTIFLLEY
jgi:hypothetical protein